MAAKKEVVPGEVPRTPIVQDLMVFKDGCSFRVSPGIVHVRSGDTLVWRAIDTGVIITIPFVDASNPTIKTVEGRSGCEESLTIVEDIPKGVYSYSIYCTASKTYARGDSDPKIIIDK